MDIVHIWTLSIYVYQVKIAKEKWMLNQRQPQQTMPQMASQVLYLYLHLFFICICSCSCTCACTCICTCVFAFAETPTHCCDSQELSGQAGAHAECRSSSGFGSVRLWRAWWQHPRYRHTTTIGALGLDSYVHLYIGTLHLECHWFCC